MQFVTGAVACVVAGTAGFAQQPGRVYTAADYARAESAMQYNVDPLVFHAVEHPVWLGDGRLWYRDNGPDGVTFRLVDPARHTVGPAFDHTAMANALTDAIRNGVLERNGALRNVSLPIDARLLPLEEIEPASGNTVLVVVAGERLRCELGHTPRCEAAGRSSPLPPGVPYELSPDGKSAVYRKNGNLWLHEVAGGAERQLTSDGTPEFGYGTDDAGWRRSDNPIVVWSPDSKRIATFQLDLRPAAQMARVGTAVGHPKIDVWRYPLAGDAELPKLYRVVIDVRDGDGAAKVVRLAMPADLHRGTLCDDLACDYGHGWDDVQWSADSRSLAFVSTSRDHKQEVLRIADAATGQVRTVMSDRAATYLESGVTKICWRYLSRSNEILWYSQRDDWGQLYLYDAATGALKNQITRGVGNVTELLHVEEERRTIEFLAVGREAGWDPYYAAAYRVNYDGSGLRLLTPAVADHAVIASPDGRFLLDVASTPTTPQVPQVIDDEGRSVVPLPQQDIAKLEAAGWHPLTPFTVKARDGKTDLYGFLFTPAQLDPAGHYPVVDFIYPGPQEGSCGSRSFAASHKDMQALAELGFAVLCLDGTGTPMRSKSFHDAHYGDMGDNTIPDQVAGIRQLAARFPWMDSDRVGIYGHSGGGAAAAAAMFHFPEFFKVGISESGNHDNRDYEDDWAEKWQGLLADLPNGTTNYDNQANERDAAKLQGHLLLMHGTMDDNVPPENTLLVVRALIQANKDFDLLLLPDAEHSYGEYAPYVTRRRWDYFVRWLAGGVPPENYRMKRFGEQ